MEQTTCKNCGQTGSGKFCHACGEPYHQHRITLSHMLHEAVHLITHFDKGFLYTLKEMVTNPGNMQREYIEGKRKGHQKPFSMFFVCGTIAALGLYWITSATGKLHHVDADPEQEHFYRHYFVLMQMALVPLYALVNYVIYYKSKYNYAEFLVMLLYNTAFLFVIVVITSSLKLIFGPFDTAYIEAIVVTVYNIITYVNIFKESKRWVVVLKVLLTSVICILIAKFASEAFKDVFLDKDHKLISFLNK